MLAHALPPLFFAARGTPSFLLTPQAEGSGAPGGAGCWRGTLCAPTWRAERLRGVRRPLRSGHPPLGALLAAAQPVWEGSMKLPRRKFLRLAAGAAALPAVSRMARAQTYPSRPLRAVVAFAPGGVTDTFARLMAQKLTERLGKQVYVENIA